MVKDRYYLSFFYGYSFLLINEDIFQTLTKGDFCKGDKGHLCKVIIN